MDSADVLKLRTLLHFYNSDEKMCTVTNIARILGEQKYTISRLLTELEKEGLVDKSNSRNPFLTKEGKKKAFMYQERIEIITNHLMYEGVDVENARKDALHWALYNSERSMEAIKEASERYRVKRELRDRKSFNGAVLCRLLRDGAYQFPFVIYREQVKNGSNISMANEAFEHPCTLLVQSGEGTILLRSQSITAVSGITGEKLRGRVKSFQYFDQGSLIPAEMNGNVISFPAAALQFMNMGAAVGQILHGSVYLSLESTCGNRHMPESKAVFTILI